MLKYKQCGRCKRSFGVNRRKEVLLIKKATGFMSNNKTAVFEKVKESAISVLPIFITVMLICFTVSPISADLMLCFIIGALLLIVGMGFFSLGAEMSMTPIGSTIGTSLTATKNLPLILIVAVANEGRTDTS